MADTNSKTKNDTHDNDDYDTTVNVPGQGERHTIDPERGNPDEEVTPKNVQSPISDDDKDRQNDVLAADHVRLGYPANMEPRTDDERKKMEDEGLIDKVR